MVRWTGGIGWAERVLPAGTPKQTASERSKCPSPNVWSTSSTTSPELDGRPDLPWCSSSTGSSTPATPRRIAARHLVDQSGGGRVVASFDVDEFHDYRARRPAMSFVRDHYEELRRPSAGRPAARTTPAARRTCCCTAPSPTTAGRRSPAPSAQVVEQFGVRPASRMGSVPMAVPHTRPIAITHHANDPELLSPGQPLAGRAPDPVQRPGAARAAAGGVGSRRHGLRGAHPALRRPVRLPAGLGRAAGARRARRPADRRPAPSSREAAPRRRARSPRTSPTNEEVGDVVPASSSSTTRSSAPRSEGSSLLAEDEPMPTGEEIGRSSSSSWPGSTPTRQPEPVADGPSGPRAVRRRARRAARPRGHRRQPVPRAQPDTAAAAGLRRPGGRAGAGRRRSARSTPGSRVHSLHSYFLLPRRHRRADRLRRRSGSATAVPSRPGGWSRASTAARSST